MLGWHESGNVISARMPKYSVPKRILSHTMGRCATRPAQTTKPRRVMCNLTDANDSRSKKGRLWNRLEIGVALCHGMLMQSLEAVAHPCNV